MAVPLHLVSGFLGAGKTTTLTELVRGRRGERTAVLVNDIGTGGIDAATLAPLAAVASIDGTCVCCTAPEGFVGSLTRLLDEHRPDRVFVEPTGLARPADLVDTLRRSPLLARLELRPVVVVVDPHLLDDERVRDQALAADVLVANRVDLATPAQLEAFRAFASGLWPGPLRVVETSFGRLPTDVLDWPTGATMRPAEPHDREHEPDVDVRTLVFGPAVRFVARAVREALGELTRAKGMVHTDEGWVRLDVAGGTTHVAPTAWRRDSRLDLIGAADVVARAKDAVEAARDTRPIDASTVEVALADGRTRAFDRAALAALPGQIADVGALVPKRQGAAVPLSAVLAAAGAVGRQIVVVAADGFTSPPTALADLGRGVLVHTLGEAALPGELGGPFRLLVPDGPSACANVKAVVRLVVR